MFRFFFVYLLLQIGPWHWFDQVPYLIYATRSLRMVTGWAVENAHAQLFHTYEKLIPVNGSGDTSFAFTELKLYVLVALIACVVWSAVNFKRATYSRLDYWLRTFVRYYGARCEVPDSVTIKFWTKVRNDSLYVQLIRTARHFQLAGQQFHWLSEYN